MHLTLEPTVRLAGGGQLPRLGYGVYQARGQECTDGVAQALRAGYRHIDSAQGYRNEDLVAKGVEAASVPRSDLFLTTKYMPTHKVHSADAVYKYLRSSLEKLDPGDGGYIDLMLIHAAWGGQEGRANNWAALARAQKEGWVKDIGVSNFGVQHLKDLPAPTPAVNQIELHPWCQQREIVSYCAEHGIVVEAYSPLVRADKDRLAEPAVVEISKKHNKQPTQVLVRWSLQKGFVPLPKSVQPERIKANADVFDFELDEEDMKRLDALDRGKEGAVTWNPVDTD